MSQEKSKIWISIVGSSSDDEYEGEGIQIQTEGQFYREREIPCIRYDEPDSTGMGDTTTILKLEGEQVSMIRIGEVNSLMEFKKGNNYEGTYNTPFGAMIMGIVTKAVSVDYDDIKRPLNVQVDYDIEIQGQPPLRQYLNIKVKDYSN